MFFQFRVKSERDWVLQGGSWYYNHSMILLTDYNGIGEVSGNPFQFMEVWVAVKGLSNALHNKRALTLIGNALGKLVHFDKVSLKRREVMQQIWVVHDTCHRIRTRRSFLFSPKVYVVPELNYDNCLAYVWLVASSCTTQRVVKNSCAAGDYSELSNFGGFETAWF